MKNTKKQGPIEGSIIEIPSQWYTKENIHVYPYANPPVEYYSVWGTSDDHEYGKRELEEKFSKVEEYTPEPPAMPNLGLLNWADFEWKKYKEEEAVEEEAVWDPDEWSKLSDNTFFGGLRTGDISPIMFPRILSEIKYECTGKRQI